MPHRQIKKVLIYSTNTTTDMIPDKDILDFLKKQKPRQLDYHFVIFPDGTLQADLPLTKTCRHGNPQADAEALTIGVVGGLIPSPTPDDPTRLIPGNTITDAQRDTLTIFLELQLQAAEKDGNPLPIYGCNQINPSMPPPGFDVPTLLQEGNGGNGTVL